MINDKPTVFRNAGQGDDIAQETNTAQLLNL